MKLTRFALGLSEYAERVRIVEGDVLDARTLDAAMVGQDVVYANLAGQLEKQARESLWLRFGLSSTSEQRIAFRENCGLVYR